MDVQQSPCNRQAIERFLADGLSATEQATFETHLDACPACRQCLDELAADGAWWEEARGYLSGTDPSPDRPETAATTLAGLRPYLTPTDDPRHLGRLGGYGVVGLIGCGGMGVVLKGFDAALNRYVAIKLLSPQLAASGAARQRFAREARAAAAVVHDNVVAIHAVADAEGLPYFVMPYAQGPSLENRLRRDGALKAVEVARIGMQIASGLAAAHAQGLVHRDIKPANILLEEGVERVTITDFGLARAVDDASLTRSGVIAGTPQYMSPEQAAGMSVDHRSDLFSLGSVLYAMCTGRPPFRADTMIAVLRRVEESRPRPIREINPDIPEWLTRVVEKLHAKDPADRFQTAAEVATLLEGYLAHLTQPTVVSAPALPPPAPRRPRPWWLAVAAAAVVGAGVIYLLAGQMSPAAGGPVKEYYRDFRSGGQDPNLKWINLDGSEVIEPGDRGLRIKLLPNRTRKDPAGIEVPLAVNGGFEITAGYELVDTNPPATTRGVGFELYVALAGPAEEGLSATRTRGTNSRNEVSCGRHFTIDGSRRHDGRNRPAAEAAGRLRLVRSGSRAVFLIGDGAGDEFREIAAFDSGVDDVKTVRLTAFPNLSNEPVDVRLVDLRVRGDKIVSGSDAAAAGSRWPLIAAILGVLVILGLALIATRRYLQRRTAGSVTGAPLAKVVSREIHRPVRRWWLTAAAAVTVVGICLVLWPSDRREPEALPLTNEVYQDFRSGKPHQPGIVWAGLDGTEVMEPDDRGLRIKLLPSRTRKDPGGLGLMATTRGDFEVTAGYEIVSPDRPKTGQGTGVELYLMTSSADKAICLGRVRHVDGNEAYWCSYNAGPKDKRKYDVRQFPAPVAAGKLRISRIGSEVILGVADENSDDFRELTRYDFGTDDLAMARFGAYPGQSTEPVDVRLVDLRVRASGIRSDVMPVANVAVDRPKRWLTAATGIGLFLIVGLTLVGVRRFYRRKADAGVAVTPEPAPALSFTCPECGASVKAPAAFAGKKGKCPKCGRAVQVPAATTPAP
jgi:hypothetical protein